MHSLRLNPLRCLGHSRVTVAVALGMLGVSPIACGAADSSDEAADQGALTNETTTLGDGHVCTDKANLDAPLPCPLSRGVPETNILPELLENGNLFASSFYDRHPGHHRGAQPGDANGGVPLKLTDEISKNYYFPTRY